MNTSHHMSPRLQLCSRWRPLGATPGLTISRRRVSIVPAAQEGDKGSSFGDELLVSGLARRGVSAGERGWRCTGRAPAQQGTGEVAARCGRQALGRWMATLDATPPCQLRLEVARGAPGRMSHRISTPAASVCSQAGVAWCLAAAPAVPHACRSAPWIIYWRPMLTLPPTQTAHCRPMLTLPPTQTAALVLPLAGFYVCGQEAAQMVSCMLECTREVQRPRPPCCTQPMSPACWAATSLGGPTL